MADAVGEVNYCSSLIAGNFLQQLNSAIFEGRYFATLNFHDFGEFVKTESLNFSRLPFLHTLNFFSGVRNFFIEVYVIWNLLLYFKDKKILFLNEHIFRFSIY